MASDKGIIAAWKTLTAAGCKGGPSTNADRSLILPVWRMVFTDIDDRDLMMLVAAHLASEDCQWWPQPGLLIRHARRATARQLDVADADMAWGEVYRLVEQRGYYKGAPERYSTDENLDAAYKVAVRACGGWAGICHTDNVAATRAAFRGAFRGAVEQAKTYGRLSLPGQAAPAISQRDGFSPLSECFGIPLLPVKDGEA